MFTRWFSQSVRAEALFDRLRQSAPGLRVQHESTMLGMAGGNRRLKKRIDAFDAAVEQHGFTHCGDVGLHDDYNLPLVYEERDEEFQWKLCRAWLCGQWRNEEFAWLKGCHSADPMFRGKDDGFISFVLMALFGRKGVKANRMRKMHFETIVFSEELPLPDVVLGHSHIGVTPYLKKGLKSVSQRLQGIPRHRLMTWGATSDLRGTVGLYKHVADLFNSRKCMFQVIGGRVVVFLNYTGRETSGLVKSVQDIEQQLDFAHEVFQRLKAVAEAQEPVNEPTISYEEASVGVKASRREERNRRRKGYRIGWGKLIAGAMMMVLGGIMCLATFLPVENPTAKKKRDARIVFRSCACFSTVGMFLTAWGAGAFASRNRVSGARVTTAEAQSTGLSSAKYFQS